MRAKYLIYIQYGLKERGQIFQLNLAYRDTRNMIDVSGACNRSTHAHEKTAQSNYWIHSAV